MKKKIENKEALTLCKGYHIKISFSILYYPQVNGHAEATNKTIRSIILKLVNKSHRDWHASIPYALWAYRMSIKTPTGATPFSLFYGVEALVPLEIKITSLHFVLQDYITDEVAHQIMLDQLLLLDER